MITIYETIIFKYFKKLTVQQNQQITTCLSNCIRVMLLHHSTEIFFKSKHQVIKEYVQCMAETN